MNVSLFSPAALEKRRQRAEGFLNQTLGRHESVIIFCGEPQGKPGGLDQTYSFLPQPEYYWLTGFRRPWGVLVYNQSQGWTHFQKPVSREEILWEGEEPFDLGAAKDHSTLTSWLSSHHIESAHFIGTSSQNFMLKSHQEPSRQLEVQEALNRARRSKDSEEVALVQKAAQAASQGYQLLHKLIQAGISERELQLEYEMVVLKAGSDKFPYDSLFGSGPRSAVLHATPSQKKLKDGELLLVDAGADCADYCVDITRTFAVSGEFDSRQKSIVNLVRAAHQVGVDLCTPGRAWKEIHEKAALVMSEGLRSLGLLTCAAEDAVATGAIGVFFPHGIGHMVGQRVRDVGGDVTRPPAMSAGVRLRANILLEENFLMTVEPGLYFVRSLIEDSETRKKYSHQINWTEVEKWKDFGGCRHENDVLVAAAPKNLTEFIS